ncbi:MAG: group II intron reverse transcriptase/maturase [Candidatus Binatia bacterium]
MTESPGKDDQLMAEVVARENWQVALKQVKSNRGSAGVDGMTVDERPAYLRVHWPQIREQLLTGHYQPQPIKRVEIPKPGGGVRKLGISTVRDRFLQQALLQVLQPRWDSTFSEHSYGFRPGRSAFHAVAQAQQYLRAGYRWVVDIDLEKFFDRVNPDNLMGQVEKRIRDKGVSALIRRYLKTGILAEGLVRAIDEGTAQGGPLSPLLSNLLLDQLDRELEQRGHRFVRYADDANLYVRSERAGRRVMESGSRFVLRKLKLRVKGEKSAVGRPWERKFLGVTFTAGSKPKGRIAPQALKRFKARIGEHTSRTRGISLERMIRELRPYLVGWRNYFGFCEGRSILKELDSWIRRRLRCMLWKQWGRRRYRELRKRGVSQELAWNTAKSAQGPWRLSRSPALSFALPAACVAFRGLPRVAEAS